MRIQLKSADEIRIMREAGLVAESILDEVCAKAAPGVSTWELDRLARAAAERLGLTHERLATGPTPLGDVLVSLISAPSGAER